VSIEESKFLVDLAQTVVIAIIGVMNWLHNRQRVTNDTINRLQNNIDERLDKHTERLTRVEADMRNVPNHADLAEIYREMRTISATMATINAAMTSNAATLKALNDQVARMDSFWRSKS